VTAGRARISLWRYSPALVLFAVAIADARQLTDPDLWGHVLWGRELLAHGSLPRGNLDSYSAPGFPWLHHEWLSEVLMGSLFDTFGPLGLKLLKFLCTACTISFVVLAESESGAPAVVQAVILLFAAIILVPAMQFRPQIFDFISLSAIVALLARHNWRGSSPLWIAIPIVALWSNLHGGFFIGLVAMSVYGAATILSDLLAGRGPRRGLVILATTAAAAASTLCTFLIPPARDTWHTLIYSILNPTTHSTIRDWKPLLASLTTAPGGSVEQKYFAVVLFFFAAAVVSVTLTPKGADAPLVAVAAVFSPQPSWLSAISRLRRLLSPPCSPTTWACCFGRTRSPMPILRALLRCRGREDWPPKLRSPSSPSDSRVTAEFSRRGSTRPAILPTLSIS